MSTFPDHWPDRDKVMAAAVTYATLTKEIAHLRNDTSRNAMVGVRVGQQLHTAEAKLRRLLDEYDEDKLIAIAAIKGWL